MPMRKVFGSAIMFLALALFMHSAVAASGLGDPAAASGGIGETESPSSSHVPKLINEKPGALGVIFSKERRRYIEGYPDGSFRPDDYATRAEIAAMIFRLMADSKEKSQTMDAIKNATTGDWYTRIARFVQANGIMNDGPGESFRPDATMMRLDFADMMSRFIYGGTLITNPPHRFLDVEAGNWAILQIEACALNGWVLGYEGGIFQPYVPITRAEAVTVLNRALGRDKPQAGYSHEGMPVYNDLDESHWAYWQIMEASAYPNGSDPMPQGHADGDGVGTHEDDGNAGDEDEDDEIMSYEDFMLQFDDEYLPGELVVVMRELTDAQSFLDSIPEIDAESIVDIYEMVKSVTPDEYKDNFQPHATFFHITLADKTDENLLRCAKILFEHQDVKYVSPNTILHYATSEIDNFARASPA